MSEVPVSSSAVAGSSASLPYKLACLCDLRDDRGRVLLLHRLKAPNKDLCSPIGGKLDVVAGESPAQCAQREIEEEAGIRVPLERLHLGGLISERAFEGRGHWLLFYFRVLGPVEVEERHMDEGELKWYAESEIDSLALPETDRRIIWPLIRGHEHAGVDGKPGFFSVHIDCREQPIRWFVEEGVDPTA
ncbi:MAG: NUDIX domain-containing protein [Planctomycetota bacterium]